LVSFTIISCDKDEEANPRVNQKILFQVEYINPVWGFQHFGLMIDSGGNVWNFSFPENWNNVNSSGYISLEKMEENFQKVNTIVMTIDKEELTIYYGKLLRAALGDLSEPVNEMCDAGVIIYSGYIYEPKFKRYKGVLINQWGDIAIMNKTREADELYYWLVNLKGYIK